MNQTPKPKSDVFLPRWMWGIVAIEVIVPSYFAVASVIDPSIWGEASLGAYGELYVIRNLTMSMGVAMAALWLRSYVAMFATIAARFATDVLDIGLGFLSKPDETTLVLLSVFTIVLIVVPAIGLRWLYLRLS